MNPHLLGKIPPPAMPVAPVTITQPYMASLTSVLRLFFNGVNNILTSVIGTNGGRFLEVPNGLFFSTVAQPLSVVNTAQAIQFGSTYLDNAVSVEGASNTQITTVYSGVYNFSLSFQLHSSTGSTKNIYVWISRSGTDIAYSSRWYILSGSQAANAFTWDFNIDMQAGDYIEMKWTADSVTTELYAAAAAGAHPAIPSAVMKVSFISVLPEVIPTPP